MDIKKTFNKKAFTLAEIMIAMIIIGVIAILTLPSMINSIQTRQYKSGVKKAHTVVSESFDSMKVDENYIYKLYNNDNVAATAFRNMYAKYFGFVDRQGQVISEVLRKPDDIGADYYPLNNTATKVDPAIYNGGGFLARNGMLVMVGKVPKPSSVTTESSPNALIISIDVDGPKKGDNQLGRDVFCFEVMPSDNILPVGAKSTEENTTSFDYKTYCQTDTAGGNNLNGIACTYSAINTAEYMDTLGDRNGGQNCEGVWVKDSNTCQCLHGKDWNRETKKCECPSGYIPSGSLCVNESNDKCVLKANGASEDCCQHDCENQHFDEDKGKWVCNNGAFSDEENKCTGCNTGQEALDDGTCCPSTRKSETECECSNGYEWVSQHKKCEQKCPSGQTRDSNGDCSCQGEEIKLLGNPNICCAKKDKNNLDLVNSDTATECSYDCGEGKYVKGKCICGKKDEINWDDKKCQCPKYSTWSQSNEECICNSGRIKNSSGNCVCKNGSKEDNCGCNASKGFIASSGYNDDATENQKCECDTTKGFATQIGGSECRCASSLRTNKDGVCACNDELHRVNKNGACVCDESNHWVENGNQCTCDFARGFVLVDNKCECQGNIQADGSCSATCKNGATLKSGSKTECECNIGQYSSLNTEGDSCVCDGSLHPVKSASGTYSCGCATGQIQNGTHCTSSGGNSCNGVGKYLNEEQNRCVCADGLVEVSDSVDCQCPSGWSYVSTDSEPIKKGKFEYTRKYCAPESNFCSCQSCAWISTGGTGGTCDCGGNGIEYDAYKSQCSCSGVDVTIKNSSEDGTGTNSCVCATKKLIYKERNSKYGCYTNNENDDYEINSSDDLKDAVPLMGNYKFKLTTDINVGDKWTPFGTLENPFKGEFDGNGHTIIVKDICVKYDESGTCVPANYTGFFGYTKEKENCKISNLTLKITGEVKGKNYVGALVGLNNCTVENVTVIGEGGKVDGDGIVGGFAGYNAGDITFSSVDDITTIGNEFYGGFVGENASTISTSFVGPNSIIGASDKSRGKYAGGFVGKMANSNMSPSILNCYVQAENVYADENSGGFIGYFERGIIKQSYTIADANANTGVDNFAAYYPTIKAPSVENTFYKKNNDETSNEVFSKLYGRENDKLKNPVTYLCAHWNDEPCIWKYDQNSQTYPQLLTKEERSNCYNTVGEYRKYYYTLDGDNAEFDISEVGSDECPANMVICKTKEEHLNNNNECVSCQWRQFWDREQKECSCGEDENKTADGCVCKNENAIYYEGAGCVDCLANNNDEDTSYNASIGDGECVCNDKNLIFDYDNEQKCVSACDRDEGLVYDNDSKACVCENENAVYYEGFGCIICSEYRASKNNGVCVCGDGTEFDPSSDGCIPQGCTNFEGIYYYDSEETQGCEFLPEPLEWNNGSVNCKTDTTITIETPSDLYYMSRCTYDDDITGGGTNWTSGKTFDVGNINETIAIDMTDYSYGKSKEFKPIQNFGGIFNGNSSTISNLTINLPSTDNVGLFASMTSSAKADSVYLNSFNITGKDNVGTLAGSANLQSKGIETIFVNNTTLTGNEYVGGVVGYITYNTGVTIMKLGAIARITSSSNSGGLFGYVGNTGATVKNFLLQKCYAMSYFSNTSNAGGLVGFVANNTNLYSAGNSSLAGNNKSYFYQGQLTNACARTENSNRIQYLITDGINGTTSCPTLLNNSGYTCTSGTTYPYFSPMMISDDTRVTTVNSFINP